MRGAVGFGDGVVLVHHRHFLFVGEDDYVADVLVLPVLLEGGAEFLFVVGDEFEGGVVLFDVEVGSFGEFVPELGSGDFDDRVGEGEDKSFGGAPFLLGLPFLFGKAKIS